MKLLFKPYILFVLIFLSITSCSSLPGRKETRTLDRRNKAAGYQQDGITQFNSGRFAQALDLFELAYELNASIDYEEGIVLTLNSMGKTKLSESKNEEAFNLFSKALLIVERLNNELLLMRTKGNIADFYIKNAEIDKAYEILQVMLVNIDGIKNEESAYLAHTMSLVLRKKGQYDEALSYLSSSLSYNQKNNAYRALAEDYYMMSSINSLQKKYPEAFEYAQKALEYDKMIEYSPGIAADLEALSLIAKKMGKKDESELYLKRSLAVLDAIANINKIENELTELDENQDL